MDHIPYTDVREGPSIVFALGAVAVPKNLQRIEPAALRDEERRVIETARDLYGEWLLSLEVIGDEQPRLLLVFKATIPAGAVTLRANLRNLGDQIARGLHPNVLWQGLDIVNRSAAVTQSASEQTRAEVAGNVFVDWARVDLAERRGELLLALHQINYDVPWQQLERRFACACCRAVQHKLSQTDSSEALDVIERFAYGHASFEEFVRARNLAKLAARRVRRRSPVNSGACAASEAVRGAAHTTGFMAMILSSRAAWRAGFSIAEQSKVFNDLCTRWLWDSSGIAE